MNANELRIGNLVLFDGVVHKIEVIDGYASFVYFEEFGDNEFPLNKIEPIPLTEEWLLRFGFELLADIAGDFPEKHYGISIVNGDKDHPEKLVISLPLYECYIGDYDNDDYYIMNEQVVYVHQLQNLYFALTKTELTLKP